MNLQHVRGYAHTPKKCSAGIRCGRGFTLVELMIVIAIVGIILAIAIPSFSESRAKSRDKSRISDLSRLEFALEVYYEANGRYPTGVDGVVGEGGSIDTTLSPYIGSIPSDPRGSVQDNMYEYIYAENSSCGTVVYAKTMERSENENAAAVCGDLSGHVIRLGGFSPGT